MARQQLEQPRTLLPLQLNGNELTAGAGLAVLRGINPLITSTMGAACIMGLKAAKDATSQEDAPLGRVGRHLALQIPSSNFGAHPNSSQMQSPICEAAFGQLAQRVYSEGLTSASISSRIWPIQLHQRSKHGIQQYSLQCMKPDSAAQRAL